MKTRSGTPWRNWAGTESCRPTRICYPSSSADIVTIVNEARRNGKKIRVAGRGHTMGPLSLTDGYLVMLDRLERIGPVDETRGLVTIESGVTVGALDRVLRRHRLVMPTNVVLTNVRYGGVIATGCHGAGWECPTISDLVEAVTIITYEGKIVRFSEATHGAEVMNAVRCNLGGFGIMHEIVLRVEPMFNLLANDRRLPMTAFEDPAELKQYVTTNDYVEAFWPPMASGLWAKSWNRTDAPARRTSWSRAPRDLMTTEFMNVLWRWMRDHPATTAPINNFLYQTFIPKNRSVILDAADAMHYRDHIGRIPVHIMSFAVKVDPDCRNIQRAWQLIIDKVREHAGAGKLPLNLMIELRAIGSSNVLLSPAAGEPGEHHCYFELLSFNRTPGHREFFDEVAQAWMDIPELHARPHWAKYFYDIPGIIPYIHKVWGNSLKTFAGIREELDPAGMFLNPALERILYGASSTQR